MAIVTTDDRHYGEIAAALRSCLSSNGVYRPGEMAQEIPTVFEAGAAAGREEREQECQMEHFATVLPGSGTDTLTFHVPFEPDAVTIIGFDPVALAVNRTVMFFNYDLRAFGILGGFIQGSYNQKTTSIAMTTESAKTRYSRREDGTVTIGNCNPDSASHLFTAGVMYSVTAVKYTDKTDRERITEMVTGLTGSGSLILNKGKVNAAFTDEEWAALIAQKPNWTFAFIG